MSYTGPAGYERARDEASAHVASQEDSEKKEELLFLRTVDQRPYFPLLKVDPNDEDTVLNAANIIVKAYHDIHSCNNNNDDNNSDATAPKGKVTVIVGGLTNALYKVDLPSNYFLTPASSAAPLSLSSSPTTTSSTSSSTTTTSVLVRIFGAEGLIDRDVESSDFAALCSARPNILHSQLNFVGRFANGRVETWISNMRPARYLEDLQPEKLQLEENTDGEEVATNEANNNDYGLMLEVARQMARLHYGLNDDNTSSSFTDSNKDDEPSLWKVTQGWIDELSAHFANPKLFQHYSNETKDNDVELLTKLFLRATLLQNDHSTTSTTATSTSTSATSDPTPAWDKASQQIIQHLSNELSWLKTQVEHQFPNAPIVFCHNDVNAANILLHTTVVDVAEDPTEEDGDNNTQQKSQHNHHSRYNDQSVAIIDYEYGSVNYAMFDVANFNCEHCGGLDSGVPNYAELMPSEVRKRMFLKEYVRERDLMLASKKQKGELVAVNGAKEEDDREEDEIIANLSSQVELFELASHFYWGTWGILQSTLEVMDGTFVTPNIAIERLEGKAETMNSWDNLRYGKTRLEWYWICKERVVLAAKKEKEEDGGGL